MVLDAPAGSFMDPYFNMNQQQQRSPQPTGLSLTLRVLGAVHLLLGVPLAVFVLMSLISLPQAIPVLDGTVRFFGALILLLIIGLNGAGVCIFLRQLRLARAFQWLLALSLMGYLGNLVYIIVLSLPYRIPLSDLLGYLGVLALGALCLFTLMFVLRRSEED